MLRVNLFFDESGKNDDTIKTMGSLMVPEKVYSYKDILELNERLKLEKFKLHWTQYNGGNKEAEIYKEIVTVFSKYLSLCEFNIIRYDYPNNVSREKLNNMIYSKIPERVMYGLLRYQGKGIDVNANIYVEDANIYKKLELHKTLDKEMNRQALYRGINFEIEHFSYKHKNEEIGVEFTDLILGVVRNIVENKSNSIRSQRKNYLIVEFLKNNKFKEFIKNIKYFEWDYSRNLTKIDFSDYVNIFLSNQKEWIEYLEKES